MKRRRECSASDVDALHARLEQRLSTLALETQPKVAARLLELAQSPKAELRDFAEAIKTDWSLVGRLLKLANSAFYAQRAPVTTIDRAVVVLGLDRTKAVALGFYLSKIAGIGVSDLTRSVWGQSVYRASLCSQLARRSCPQFLGEAFIVGLLLDCGQPLMLRLIGEEYRILLAEATSPGKLFALEYDRLEFTHVDVFAVLAKRWRLPRLLTRPIHWHHTLPPVGPTSDPAVLLQRLAYYAGSLQLEQSGLPKHAAPSHTVAERMFDLTPSMLADSCAATGVEYDATIGMFDEVAQRLPDVESLAEVVRLQLVDLLDEQVARSIRLETRGGIERFTISGCIIEVEPGNGQDVAAYISANSGERLLSCMVNPNKEQPDQIARLLGLEDASAEELADLVRIMRAMAA